MDLKFSQVNIWGGGALGGVLGKENNLQRCLFK